MLVFYARTRTLCRSLSEQSSPPRTSGQSELNKARAGF